MIRTFLRCNPRYIYLFVYAFQEQEKTFFWHKVSFVLKITATGSLQEITPAAYGWLVANCGLVPFTLYGNSEKYSNHYKFQFEHGERSQEQISFLHFFCLFSKSDFILYYNNKSTTIIQQLSNIQGGGVPSHNNHNKSGGCDRSVQLDRLALGAVRRSDCPQQAPSGDQKPSEPSLLSAFHDQVDRSKRRPRFAGRAARERARACTFLRLRYTV